MSSTKKRTTRTTYTASVPVLRTSPANASLRMSMGGGGMGGMGMGGGMGGGLGGGMGGGIQQRNVRMSYSMGPAINAGIVSASKESVQKVVQGRNDEKQQMKELNEKFANVLSNKHKMDAMVKTLMDENEELRKMKTMPQDDIAAMYKDQIEDLMQQVRDLNDKMSQLEAEKMAAEDKAETEEIKNADLEKMMEEMNMQLRKNASDLGEMAGRLEAEKNRADALEDELRRLRELQEKTKQDNDRIREDCIEMQAKLLAALNECDLLKRCFDDTAEAFEAEKADLRQRLANAMKKSPERAAMWDTEFGKCLKQIQDELEKKAAAGIEDNKRWFESRLDTIERNAVKDETDATITKTQNATLKSELGGQRGTISKLQGENDDLRRRLHDLELEYGEHSEEWERERDELEAKIMTLTQEIADMNNSCEELRNQHHNLESEIKTYRALLDAEENSLTAVAGYAKPNVRSQGGEMLSQMIIGGGSSGGGSSQQQSTMQSEGYGKIKYNRQSKIFATIGDCEIGGDYIELVNNSATRDMNLGGYTLTRKSGRGERKMALPKDFVLRKGQTIAVWCANCEGKAKKGDLVGPKDTCDSWGKGSGKVSLSNEMGEEKAVLDIQFS